MCKVGSHIDLTYVMVPNIIEEEELFDLTCEMRLRIMANICIYITILGSL